MMFVLIQKVYIYALWLIVTCGLLLVTVNSDSVLVCPDGWHKHNTQCYWFSDFNATRGDAKLECEARNSSLVTISTSTINDFLQKHISNNTNYWIGLKIDGITNTYTWQWSSGQIVKSFHYLFINWCNGTTVGTACAVAVYSNTEPQICYESYNCGTKQRYVCEKEKLQMSSSCPDGWDEYTMGDTKCYYISVSRLSNMDAARFCWSQGARLITVTYTWPNNYLRDKSPGPNEVYWIGLSPFKWDDVTPYNWNNWDTDGPNIGARCTLLQQDGTWHHGICSELHNIICQQGAVPGSTETTLVSTRTTHTLSVGSTSLAATTEQYNLSNPNSVVTIQDGLEDQTLSHVFTSSQSPMVKESEIIAMLEKSKSDGKIVLFITIGIMSVIIVILIVALVAVVIYLRRRLKAKEPTSPQLQETPYEDVSAAVNYYNIDTENPRGNVTEKDKRELPDGTYEQLSTGQYVNTAPPLATSTYETLH